MSKATDLEEARLKRDIDVHRNVSLDVIRSTPAFAVRTPRGQKDPGHFKWDPKNSNDEISAQNIHSLERSDDNIGIHLFGDMVDVDIDTDNEWVTASLDHFLPHTSHVWGRKSRPRTHRLYQVTSMEGAFAPEGYKFLTHIAAHDKLKIEMRGGRRENARYSLMPGSLHPSGEYYMWTDVKEARATPILVPEHSLVKSVRFACVAALLAPYWTEGIRNKLCMALSGFLYKAVTYSEQMSANPYTALTKDDAEDIIRGVAEISGDDESDLPARLKTLNQTWEKAEKGTPVRGASTIAEVVADKSIVADLYALLVDAKGLVEFEDFAKDFVFWEGENKIVNIAKMHKPGVSPFMTPDAFNGSYRHRKLETPDGKLLPMTQVFLSSEHVTRVIGMAFKPDAEQIYMDEDNDQFLNEWTGFRIPPADSATEEDVAPFTNYVREILAWDRPEAYNWVMGWIADIFQHPASKPGTALVLVGKPGAGKSILGSMFLSKIIGFNHSAVLNKVDVLLKDFNRDTAYKLFMQCDEAINNRQKKDAHLLKALITDERRRVEPKGVNAYQVDDYTQYLFTSNALTDAVAIVDGTDDRRYTILEVNPKYCTASTLTTTAEKNAFFNGLNDWASDPENLAKLHRYLLDFEYERWRIRRPLESEARNDMIQASMVGLEDFLMRIASLDNPFITYEKAKPWWSHAVNRKGELEETFEGWPDFVSYEALQTLYEKYRREVRGNPEVYNAQQILKFFKKEKLVEKEPASKRLRVTETAGFDEETGTIQKVEKRYKITAFPTKTKLLNWLKVKYAFEAEPEPEDDTPSPIDSAKPPKNEVKF